MTRRSPGGLGDVSVEIPLGPVGREQLNQGWSELWGVARPAEASKGSQGRARGVQPPPSPVLGNPWEGMTSRCEPNELEPEEARRGRGQAMSRGSAERPPPRWEMRRERHGEEAPVGVRVATVQSPPVPPVGAGQHEQRPSARERGEPSASATPAPGTKRGREPGVHGGGRASIGAAPAEVPRAGTGQGRREEARPIQEMAGKPGDVVRRYVPYDIRGSQAP